MLWSQKKLLRERLTELEAADVHLPAHLIIRIAPMTSWSLLIMFSSQHFVSKPLYSGPPALFLIYSVEYLGSSPRLVIKLVVDTETGLSLGYSKTQVN